MSEKNINHGMCGEIQELLDSSISIRIIITLISHVITRNNHSNANSGNGLLHPSPCVQPKTFTSSPGSVDAESDTVRSFML
jgi:hypothetical protein